MRRLFFQLFVIACLAPVVAFGMVPDTRMSISKTDIGASPEAVFALIEDFRNWPRWSPHDKAGPAMTQAYGGAEKGPGATYEWDGADKAGAGRAQIVEATPGKSMAVDIELSKPVQGRLTLSFALSQAGAATKMEVTTQGDGNVVRYVMGRFFEAHLSRIACVAENSSKPFCGFLLREVGQQ
jgi:hypothetical protein